jgi:hypothetical protein
MSSAYVQRHVYTARAQHSQQLQLPIPAQEAHVSNVYYCVHTLAHAQARAQNRHRIIVKRCSSSRFKAQQSLQLLQLVVLAAV